jgi:hypothetical protein
MNWYIRRQPLSSKNASYMGLPKFQNIIAAIESKKISIRNSTINMLMKYELRAIK